MKPSSTGPFPYTPITRRPKIKWPDNKRLALWVIPNIETFPLDQLIPGGKSKRAPDVNNWAKREYGNRVGAFRLMKTLSRFGIRGSVALNSDVCDAAPDVIDEALKLGWELMGHGQTNSRQLNQAASIEEERELIGGTVERIKRACGKAPRGWLGPGLQETWDSLDVLYEAGIRYTGDWTTDDQPYKMNVGGKTMVSIPYGHDMGDMNAIMRGHYTPADFAQMIIDTFNVLYREGWESGRVMPISLHPFLTGTPHRIDGLNRGLEYIARYEDVWFATGGEIYDHYIASDATF